MGLVNNRAFCPNCNGKIHTRARGLGVLLPFRSGALVQTGTQCQHCGTALSGRVGLDNVAISAATAENARRHRAELRAQLRPSAHRPAVRTEPTADDVARQRDTHQQAHQRYMADAPARNARIDLDKQLLALLDGGPATVADAAARLGVKPADVEKSVARLPRGIRASGFGRKRRLERI